MVDAMLSGADSPSDGLIAEVLISTPAILMPRGTDEIQKNIISNAFKDAEGATLRHGPAIS